MRRIILVALMACLIAIPCYASNRGPLTNIYASWVSVTTDDKTLTFPYNSRDLTIHNGSAVDICVDLKGGAIGRDCVDDAVLDPSIFQLNGAETITLSDFVTGAVTFRAEATTASPVSVISTF